MATHHLLDVRVIEPQKKHTSIFNSFDEMVDGEILTILNDHDPLPLYYQFQAERPGVFAWEYLERGPMTWQVNITKTHSETVADLVRQNPKAALVFKQFKIDFCCKGNRPLKEACAEAGIRPEILKAQISKLTSENPSRVRPDEWSLDFLTDYILQNHHAYVKNVIPQLSALLLKVRNVHGKEHPELSEIDFYFSRLAEELTFHMQKEEQILFPMVKELVLFNRSGRDISSYPFESIRNPIRVMEQDHAGAGNDLQLIRELTHDFTLPANACNSFRLLYNLLEEFEADLHQHVHLENNILFPKAIALENYLK